MCRSLFTPENTSKLADGRLPSISTRAGSSVYSTPVAQTPTPTLPTQDVPGQRSRKAASKGVAYGR
jgi:hypothetical protein